MYNYPVYLQYQNTAPKFVNFVQQTANAMLFKDVNFTNDYLNIKTASTAGLDNWGIILNQPRIIYSGLAYSKVFGFANGIKPTNTDDYPQNFNHGNFFNKKYKPTIELSNTQYRSLLLLLYRKYTTNNSLAELNSIIQEYATFQGATILPYVTNSHTMEITYTFPNPLEPYEINLFLNTDCLAVPACVRKNIILL